jgi:signal peptidase II
VQERRAVPPLTAGDGRRRSRHTPLLAGVTAAVVAVDQLTKTWALHHVADRPIHLFWTLRLYLTFNSGAAFSIGRGITPFLVPLAIAVVAVMVFMTRRRQPTRGVTVAMGLILGGALGNLGDRLFRHNGGSVIDFIDPQWWPVFNLADASIVIGAILLFLVGRHAWAD